MRKLILMAVVALMTTMNVQAQTSLVGREYYCDNVMAGELKSLIADAKTESVKQMEKELGRKLTNEEMKKIDAEMKNQPKELSVVEKGTKMSMKLSFTNATEMKMTAKMSMTDEAMKAMGISWVKRKAFKAMMAMMPSEDVNYTIKNNLLIYTESGQKDTLRISPDGKHLYGVYRDKEKGKDFKYTLTRTK